MPPAAVPARLSPDTRIWIQTRATADGVELTVDDDGPGIPAADRERVLEPLQQGRDAAASAQPGTGVGLSLVDAFAQLHGGHLTLSDSPAGGVRATVTLAHAASDSPDAPTALAAPEADDAAGLSLPPQGRDQTPALYTSAGAARDGAKVLEFLLQHLVGVPTPVALDDVAAQVG